MKLARTWILLGACALLVARVEADAQARTGGSGIKVSKATPDVSSTPTTVISGGEVTLPTPFDLSAYANLNEKNVTAIMAAGDSLEIQLGNLANSKGTSQAVRDYGAMLARDHTAHLAKTIEIITDEDVGAQLPAHDPEGMRLRQMLAELQKKAAGSDWDAAFLRFQVQHHQNVIDMFTPNIKNMHDDDLEKHLEATLASLAKHRDMARNAASGLGQAY